MPASAGIFYWCYKIKVSSTGINH